MTDESIAWVVLDSIRSGTPSRDHLSIRNCLTIIPDAEDEVVAKTLQISQFQAELSAIDAANSTLHSIAITANSMEGQLSGFVSIWNAVKSNCTSVSQYLTTANGNLARKIVSFTVA